MLGSPIILSSGQLSFLNILPFILKIKTFRDFFRKVRTFLFVAVFLTPIKKITLFNPKVDIRKFFTKSMDAQWEKMKKICKNISIL